MANKLVKRCSISQTVEICKPTSMRYYFIPIRMALNNNNNKKKKQKTACSHFHSRSLPNLWVSVFICMYIKQKLTEVNETRNRQLSAVTGLDQLLKLPLPQETEKEHRLNPKQAELRENKD
ncbi:hypothetical protein HJG60_011870 [Phyllostomus discolor]|uniref:Uncharacterized protein n=1 Tax=Phyllostomus discolor TaxID=89673 RepID=A0A833ZE77_9CHIR|nr:hypothetical protein HJG60_011870 [Phyllostomus discolor]